MARTLEDETLLEKSMGLDVTITLLDPGIKRVEGTVKSSSSEGVTYTVGALLRERIFRCTCPAYTYRPDRKCKHIVALLVEARRQLTEP